MFERVIRGGLAALPDRVALVDLAIEGERIAAIGDPGSLRGVEVVDADGLLVLPGGVDPHVHLDTQFGEWRTTDDFWTGGAAAALGGTTTIIEFAIPRPGETTESALRRCLAEAQADAAVDFGLHACVTRESFRESLDQLGGLRTRGVGSVKVFSAYRDSIGPPGPFRVSLSPLLAGLVRE